MGCRCANRRCHSRDSGIDLAVAAVALGAGVDCRTSTTDRFLFFSFDLEIEAEVACGAGEVAGSGAVAVADSGAAAVAGMVASVLASIIAGTAVISDVYAVASVVVFTIHRSPILDPEIKIPPGHDVVNTPRPNVERAPARSNWPIERGDSEHRCVYRLLLET